MNDMVDREDFPSSASILSAMYHAYQNEDEPDLALKLSAAWTASWPFTYNAALIDVATRSQLPVLLGMLQKLPDVDLIKSPVTLRVAPSDAALNQFMKVLLFRTGIETEINELKTILMMANTMGMIDFAKRNSQ